MCVLTTVAYSFWLRVSLSTWNLSLSFSMRRLQRFEGNGMPFWIDLTCLAGKSREEPLHYLGKQEEMVLDTLVCRCLSFCFPLDYSTGLQVGLPTL